MINSIQVLMAQTDQLKKDMFILLDGDVNMIVERRLKTQGRQGGLIIFSAKNVETGKIIEKTVKAGTKFEQVIPEYKEMQYLYNDEESVYFMDTESYETLPLRRVIVEDYINYLKEGDKYVIMFYEEKALYFRTNKSVELEVTESVDAVKGDTATSATKMVTTETGYKVKVPLFVNKGDIITINTETGEYTGRVK